MIKRIFTVTLMLLAFAAGTAAEAKTFRYSTSGDILGLDPYTNNEGPTNTMKSNLYEGLIHRSYDLSLHPALATDWKQTDPLTWRFNLRKSNTEPVLRLNVETRANPRLLEEKTAELLELIRG